VEKLIETTINTVINFGQDHRVLLISILGGVMPAAIWTLFWLKEDTCDEITDHAGHVTYICEPEPKSILFFSFILGALLVPLVLFFETLVYPFFAGMSLIVSWAFLEELAKFLLFVTVIAKTNKIKSPIDPLVYLSIIAIGFSALENSLFLYQSLVSNDSFINTIIGQNYRFLGASILHVLCSGLIGLFYGFSFYASRSIQILAVIFGFILSVVLHSFFNYFIIVNNGSSDGLGTQSVIWGIGIIFLLLIEGLRYLAKKKKTELILNNL
jgi:RsiW-degrading membrane proteinase PrsW (M82 family)